MVKQTKIIEKNFSVEVAGETISVILKSHLFIPRKQEPGKIRAHMFKSRFQYEELIKSAVKDGILEYAHQGRVVYVFTSLQKKYGALFDVVKIETGYEVSIITIDALKEHNYVGNELFFREKNKIYSEFVLPMSYNRQVTQSRVTVIGEVQFFKTYKFESILKKYDRVYKEYSLDKIAASVYSRLRNSFLEECKQYRLKFERDYQPDLYFTISIEPLKHENDKTLSVIFVTTSLSCEASNGDNLELIEMGSIEKFFPTKVSKKIGNGLRIKKKAA